MSSANISTLSSTLLAVLRPLSFGLGLLMLIFGSTDCFLNILLFSRRQFHKTSCGTYFLVASVAMFAQVSFYGGINVYAFYYGHPINYILSFCKIFYYVIQSLSIMFRWTLAAACLDRYALSSTNARFRSFASVQIAHRVVVAFGLVSIVFPVHNIIFYGLRGGYCVILYGYAASMYNGIFTIISITGIPISIMIICTLLIGQNLAKKRERHQLNVHGKQRRHDRQALVMLFAQVILYIILTIPYVSYSIYDAISLSVSNKSTDRLAIERFILSLTGTVIVLFPTGSFYLYTLTSSIFRKELFIMLNSIFCCKCNVNNRRIQPTTSHIPSRVPIVQGLRIQSIPREFILNHPIKI